MILGTFVMVLIRITKKNFNTVFNNRVVSNDVKKIKNKHNFYIRRAPHPKRAFGGKSTEIFGSTKTQIIFAHFFSSRRWNTV